jgi:hypothetical protein
MRITEIEPIPLTHLLTGFSLQLIAALPGARFVEFSERIDARDHAFRTETRGGGHHSNSRSPRHRRRG